MSTHVSVTALGSGGWMPSAQRETSAYLVKRGNAALLLDAGTGTRRLVTEAALLSAVETLDVAFSHFHGDHVTGLSYLPAVSQRVALGALFVPGHPVYADGKRLVRTLLQSPYQPFKVENIFADMREMGTRIGTAVGHIQTRWQMGHSDPSLAFRLEDLFAYCTDTPYDGGNVDFASGCSLLMHEAWNYGEIVDASHSSAKQAGRLAQEAGVDELVLTHLHPLVDAESLSNEARTEFERSSALYDGWVMDFPSD